MECKRVNLLHSKSISEILPQENLSERATALWELRPWSSDWKM